MITNRELSQEEGELFAMNIEREFGILYPELQEKYFYNVISIYFFNYGVPSYYILMLSDDGKKTEELYTTLISDNGKEYGYYPLDIKIASGGPGCMSREVWKRKED